MNTAAKKITMATVKSLIRKNEGNIYIKVSSSFDGMIDGCRYNSNASFEKAKTTKINTENNLGICGAWFVGQSRDWLTEMQHTEFYCIKVSNSCGSFTLGFKL